VTDVISAPVQDSIILECGELSVDESLPVSGLRKALVHDVIEVVSQKISLDLDADLSGLSD
jgi:hypothetical protein